PSTTSDTAAARKTRNAITLGQYPWMKGSSAMTGVRQMRASVRMFGRVQRIGRFLAQRLQDQLADRLERIEHSVPPHGDGFHVRRPAHPLAPGLLDEALAGVRGISGHLLLRGVLDRPPRVERRLEVLDGRGIRQIPLVVLDDEGDLGQVVAVLRHVVVQVLHRIVVRLHAHDMYVYDDGEYVAC